MARAQLTAAVTLTTDGSGACTAYSSSVMGAILGVVYKPGAIATGATVTVTTEDSLQSVVAKSSAGTSTVVWYPRPQVHDASGTAATLNGTQAMRDYAYAAGERIKIVVASGGAAATGSIQFIIG